MSPWAAVQLKHRAGSSNPMQACCLQTLHACLWASQERSTLMLMQVWQVAPVQHHMQATRAACTFVLACHLTTAKPAALSWQDDARGLPWLWISTGCSIPDSATPAIVKPPTGHIFHRSGQPSLEARDLACSRGSGAMCEHAETVP